MVITTANRLDGINEYYFAGKLRQIADMRAAGRQIINLGIGSPDLPPDPALTARLSEVAARPETHGYQSYTGIPALRRAWAGWYERYYEVRLNDTQVLPLIGSKEGIVHIAMTFLQPGDLALVPNPGYPAYTAATRLAGATPLLYTLDAQNDWQPDLDALEAQPLERVKLMWVNYPHMPTGAPAKAGTFERLVAFARRHRILLVNDNPYSFILSDQPQSLLAVPGAFDLAIELNSLSKSHNMAGWRIGALLGREDYLGAVLRFKSNMDSGQFLPMQEAAIAALNLPGSWYATQNALYRERQVQALRLLNLLDCTYAPGQQGLFVWGRIPGHWNDAYALSDALLEQAGVFVTPGGIFGSAGEHYIRISLCQELQVFAAAAQNIQENMLEPQLTH